MQRGVQQSRSQEDAQAKSYSGCRRGTKWCVLSGFLALCLGVCVEWCDMFVERFGVGFLRFSFCCIAQSELSSSF